MAAVTMPQNDTIDLSKSGPVVRLVPGKVIQKFSW